MKAVTPTLDCTGRSTSRWPRFLPQLFAQKSTSAPPVASSTAPVPWRPFASACLIVLLAVAATPVQAITSLGVTTSSSPIRVDFDETTGRMTVTVKPVGTYQGATWTQGVATTGNQTWTNGTIVTNPAPTDTKLTATATINGIPSVSVILQLDTSAGAGDLIVTLQNPSANLAGTPNKVINYPHPFYTSTTPSTTGYAIIPLNSGHVVPTSDTTFAPLGPVLSRHMEFVGGSDANNDGAWIGIIESHADATLALEQATVNGASHIGLTPSWMGSNENTAHTKELLSYDRVIRYHFFPSGGYVAVAKRFRQYANAKGWLKTLSQKAISNPAVLDLIGAPIIYLWGDGHDTAFPGILKAKGISKALLQLSTNHLDQFNKFPNNDFPDGRGWFDAVKAQGFRGGFYDIYESTGSGTGYGGKVYLWPPAATSGAWATVKEDNSKSGSYDICAAEQAIFASGTRLPAHVNRFHMDAAFFDVLITKNGVECYDNVNGHFETRADDLDSRAAVLNAAYSYFDPANPGNPPLLTGSEQARSWAVPYQIWGEGVQHLGKYDSQGTVSFPTVTGGWNGNTYPDVVTDMKVLTTGSNSQLASMLSEGYQVPLWDLVFHDCLLATLHWERAHNKFLYVWDHADLAALIRGQTVLFNLVYKGLAGNSTDTIPAYVPNATSGPWSMRWQSSNDIDNVVQNRVLKTFNDVCRWHEQVGLMEMTDHQWLSTDRAVQMAEFSPDGGVTGNGIIVNFGVYDGGTTGGKSPGVNWSKTIRGTSYSQANVAPNSYVKYSWSNNTPPTISNITDRTISMNGTTGAVAFTVGDAETAAGSLTVSGGSSNTTLVPVANITFGGSGANRTVTVTPATGQTGTATITVTVSDGSLTAQDTFLLTVNSTSTTVSFTSEGGNDGWLLENTPGSNTASTASNPVGGNSNNNGAGALRIGDDAGNRQFRSIVSFNVTGLPAGAVIESATLRFTRSAGAGNVSGFGTSFNAAIKGGSGFANSASLQWGATLNDFSNTSGPGGVGAPPDLAAAVTGLTVVGVGSPTTGTLTSGALALLGNGRFQFRIDFPTKTVNAGSQDYVGFYSGENSTPANRPVLSITYH